MSLRTEKLSCPVCHERPAIYGMIWMQIRCTYCGLATMKQRSYDEALAQWGYIVRRYEKKKRRAQVKAL